MNVSLTCHDQHMFLIVFVDVHMHAILQSRIRCGCFSQAHQESMAIFESISLTDFLSIVTVNSKTCYFHHNTRLDHGELSHVFGGPKKISYSRDGFPFRISRTQLINPWKLGGFCRWMENDAAKNVIRIACILARKHQMTDG